MFYRDTISVKRIRTDGKSAYTMMLANSHGRVVWSASRMTKSEATNQLLEIGLPVYRLRSLLADAEAEVPAEPAA